MFNEDQQKLIVEFFANLGTEIGDPDSKSYRKIKADSKWFPDLDEMLPIVNEVLSKTPEKIGLLKPLIDYYNSTPYSISKGRSILIKSLQSLSEKFEKDSIPLVYTTSLMPRMENYLSFVWNEIASTKSFSQEDYGHVDLIDALTHLQEDCIITIKSFTILSLNPKNITFKILLQYQPKKLTGIEKAVLFRDEFKLEGRAGDFSYFSDGSIRYQKEILEMRSQLKVMARLFIDHSNQLLTVDDIKEEIIRASRRDKTSNDTIAKYVNELRSVYKKVNGGKDAFINQKEEGWFFRP